MRNEHDRAWEANMKANFDQMLAHQASVNGLAIQAMQNAVETANLVGKQAVAHRDLATDRQWNIDEVAQLTANAAIKLDAIAAIIVSDVCDRVLYAFGQQENQK